MDAEQNILTHFVPFTNDKSNLGSYFSKWDCSRCSLKKLLQESAWQEEGSPEESAG